MASCTYQRCKCAQHVEDVCLAAADEGNHRDQEKRVSDPLEGSLSIQRDPESSNSFFHAEDPA